eukprot:g3912.t1
MFGSTIIRRQRHRSLIKNGTIIRNPPTVHRNFVAPSQWTLSASKTVSRPPPPGRGGFPGHLLRYKWQYTQIGWSLIAFAMGLNYVNAENDYRVKKWEFERVCEEIGKAKSRVDKAQGFQEILQKLETLENDKEKIQYLKNAINRDILPFSACIDEGHEAVTDYLKTQDKLSKLAGGIKSSEHNTDESTNNERKQSSKTSSQKVTMV